MKKVIANKLIFCIILSLIVFFLSLTKIYFANADLGRHLKNGELIFSNPKLLFTNFYSYTFSDYPFVNHHWLSGVVFFFVQKLFGFGGLSIFTSFILSLSVLIALSLSLKKNNLPIVIGGFLFSLPIILYRREIRPEIFSSLFFFLIFFLLIKARENIEYKKYLWLIPFIMLFWINLHSYFFLGFFLLAVFFIDCILNKNYLLSKRVFIVGIFSILSSLLNPFFLKGLFYPLNIFNDYGFPLLENKTVFFLDNYFGNFPVGIYFKICFVLLILSFVYNFSLKKKIDIFFLLSAIFFSYLGLSAVRNFSLFGLFFLLVFSINLSEFKFNKEIFADKFLKITLLTILAPAIILLNINYWKSFKFGIGLRSGVEKAAEFFIKNNIKGPIYNNYDIGGYLIYYLYPQKVFVDNRPEAYPSSFFQKTYIPMQYDEKLWEEESKKYNFNSIFFSTTDLSEWGRIFIEKRLNDKNWKLTYSDDYFYILERNSQ
jgi:hypothetical protein